MTGKMFPFVNVTLNPVKYCSHNCLYCWSRAKGYVDKEPILYPKRLASKFKPDAFCFLCDCGDLFCFDMPEEYISKVLKITRENPKTQFLILTKNPRWMREWIEDIGSNCIVGATIESNRDYPAISKAPSQSERLVQMKYLQAEFPEMRRFISVEPILEFDLDAFVTAIRQIQPWAIAVGYDNYSWQLPEPPFERANQLIASVRALQIPVYEKTIRRSWQEQIFLGDDSHAGCGSLC